MGGLRSPVLPAHLALPGPSSLQQSYSTANTLAQRMDWPTASEPLTLTAIHFSGYSSGSYTAVALGAEYRLLCRRLQQPMIQGAATVGALGCPVLYLLALLLPHYPAACHRPALPPHHPCPCPWHPTLEALTARTTPHTPQLPTPNVLIQIWDCGKVPWVEQEVHKAPTYPAMLAAKADLATLCAYSTRYVPPDALEELTAYL